MNRGWYKPAVWLMWLALPITALKYWRVWDQLPARMAVHFDEYWQPNGYTSREGSLMLGLGIMTFMLLVFTIAAHIIGAQKPSAAWPMLFVFYLSIGILWFANNWIVERNLNPSPVRVQFVGSNSPAMTSSEARAVLQLHS